jgi:hypothetical protein
MEYKLKRLSSLNDKSSDLQHPKCFCGNTPEHELEIKKYIKEKNLVSNKKSIASSKVLIKELPNNPYCSSITGKYAFDLSQISNFNVYFWTSTDDPNLNPAIKKQLSNPSSSAVDWTLNQKTQCKKAFDIFTTFTGTTSTVVNNYSECDAVCVLSPLPNNFYGECYGPYYIKTEPTFVDNKIVYFISSNYLTPTNIDEGTYMYNIMIHEWGHGFGFAHPHDDGFGSTILPGVLQSEPYNYQSIGGYIQNSAFNTVMTYNDVQFFLPANIEINNNYWGYPETIMPLDALALRWMYNVQEVPAPYISAYGVQLINEGIYDTSWHSRMIVGRNQTITFGSNCEDIAFYLSNQYFTFNNLNYLRYEYIRNLQLTTSLYTKDIDSTISVLNLNNTQKSSIFIENRTLTTNLTINLIQTTSLYLYIMDLKNKYSITGNTVIRNKVTNKTITINNSNNVPVYINFNEERTITRNIVQNKLIETNHESEIQKYFKNNKFDTQKVSTKSIPPSSIIVTNNPPINPYCSSIAGKYTFDLSQISNFNVYFWTSTDNPDLNQAIKTALTQPEVSTVNDWSNYQKIQVKKALDIYTTFTSTTSTVVNDYNNCDIVCVLASSESFKNECLGPFFIKLFPTLVDNKIIFFTNSNYINDLNIQEGGVGYSKFIHNWGSGFGLEDPGFTNRGSTLMPAIASSINSGYPSIAGYIQNNAFNTIMTFNFNDFFIPSSVDISTNLTGYPQTILPLDALALRWMYNIQEIPAQYISTYGVNVINPTSEQQGQSAMIVGKNQTITFGSNNDAVNFYLTNQWFTFYNLQPIKIEYNRPIKKQWSYYPKDLDSTISTINLDNTGKAFIFLENRALKTNLTVNIQNNPNQVLNFYCMDCQQNYLIRGNVYYNRITNKKFTINNTVGATVNVYFDK